jgi:multimeric flavodoxin WrbA
MLTALAAYLAERRPGWEYQEIALWDLNVNPCNGNGHCFRSGDCVYDDDAGRVIQLLLDARGVILASPNYCLNINSTMMAFIERTTRLSHRRLLEGKGALALSTSASPFGSAQAAEYLRSILGSYGASVVSACNIGSPMIVYDYGDTEYGERLRAHADAFIAAVEDPAGHVPEETFGIDIRQLLRDHPEQARRLFRSDSKYFAERAHQAEKNTS